MLEFNNPRTMADLDVGQRILQSFFLSSMTRSGGFSTIDIGQLDGSSLLVTDMLMFIGGGSASTAGGIKVTTLAILFLAAFAEARGNGRRWRRSTAASRPTCCASPSASCSGARRPSRSRRIILLQITDEPLDYVLFDVISAFATCGLSHRLHARAPSDASQYVLAATMFLGRIGTVTLAAALAASTRRQLFRRAEERPIVG